MNSRRVILEPVFYTLILGLGVLLRLLYLGRLPLSDAEASLALQALALAHGQGSQLAPQPGYLLVTGQLFAFFGDSSFLARFYPALAGSLLPLAPLLLRKRLGWAAALVLAAGLALDPGLLALSRQAGGPIPAVSFTVLAAALWLNRKPVLSGICAALALLGGPWIWQGLLGLGIAWLATRLLERRRAPEQTDTDAVPTATGPSEAAALWKPALLALAGTLLVVGTAFFREPRGLSALAGSLAAYLAGWGTAGGISAARMAVMIPIYAPLGLGFALIAGIRAWRTGDTFGKMAVLWFFAALLVALIDPSRQPGGLAWAILPLWFLAARLLAQYPWIEGAGERAALIYTGVVLSVLVFLGLNFTSLLLDWQIELSSPTVRLLVVLGGVALLLLASLLVAWGWSSRVAAAGLLQGLVIVLLVYQVNLATLGAGVRQNRSAELWDPNPHPAEAGLLLDTIGTLSEWQTGNRQMIPVVVAGVASPSLKWALRSLPNATFVDALSTDQHPALVITPKSDQPALAAAYRGEGFAWGRGPDWGALSTFQQVNWLAFHQAPETTQEILLWARTDIFPGQSQTSAKPAP